MKTWGRYLFIVGILICLLQVWLPEFFLTGDGPCHLYNAKVLHDKWLNQNTLFYDQYYRYNTNINPNWTTSILLALLLFITNAATAEKILLTLYIILFISGFYKLLKAIKPETASYWPLAVFILVFQHLLIKGFYNFSFSVAILLWSIWAWIEFLNKKGFKNVLLFFLVTAALSFTHPLAFVFSLVVNFCILISFRICETKNRFFGFIKYSLILGAVYAFFVLMLLIYMAHTTTTALEIRLHKDRLHIFDQFVMLINRSTGENNFSFAAIIGFIVFTITAIFVRIRKVGSFNKYDGVWLALIMAIAMYLFLPYYMFGGGMVSERMEYIIYIMAIVCIASSPMNVSLQKIGGLLFYIIFIILTVVRWPGIMAASDAIADYMPAENIIKPNSVVLPLSYNHNGKDRRGNIIADHNWLFTHFAEYLGAGAKPMILLSNFEPCTNYFPLVWKDSVNPCVYLNKEEGLLGQPPYVPIGSYRKNNNVTINYVITWCFDSSFIGKGHTRLLMDQLNNNYHIVYTSPSKRIILFELNR
jgi:hypothetical protein